MKNILVISTSLRNGSNSEIVAKEFVKGAKEAGHNVELVSLKDKKIAFCTGCMACQKIGHCVIKDDANEITDKICEADVVVWSTPIYYYEMSGQMKTMIDRANSLFCRERKFKEVYLLMVAAEDEEYTPRRAISGLEGWIDCFEGVELKETLFIGGLESPNQASKDERIHKAYELGRRV